MSSSLHRIYLFAGDSLTEGVQGESYVDRVAQALVNRQGLGAQVVNAGRSGDTIRSLLARIDEPIRRYRPQWVILAVGVNDVWLPWLSDRSPGWWLGLQSRRLQGEPPPTRDLDQAASLYRTLIDRVHQAGARPLVCTCSPLGEQIASPLNQQLARLNGIIQRAAMDGGAPVADVSQAFVETLALLEKPSRYLPGEWLFTWLDRRRLSQTSPDEISRRRRLLLTYDGLHLNSRGADLWAQTILRALARWN